MAAPSKRVPYAQLRGKATATDPSDGDFWIHRALIVLHETEKAWLVISEDRFLDSDAPDIWLPKGRCALLKVHEKHFTHSQVEESFQQIDVAIPDWIMTKNPGYKPLLEAHRKEQPRPLEGKERPGNALGL